jgi:hypothetical protein
VKFFQPLSRIVIVALMLSLSAGAAVLIPDVKRVANPNPSDSAEFATSVAGIGDVNGDGIGDLVIGAPGNDRVYIISGKDRTLLRTIIDPDGLIKNRFGFAVIGVGDWDGDGKEDIAIGAPGLEGALPLPCPLPPCPANPQFGRVFVISSATGVVLKKFTPPDESLLFGYAIAVLGDVNGDGKTDLAIGAPVRLKFVGSVYAISGADGTQLWKASESGAGADPRQPIASFGSSLASLHDVNGDGKRDLVVGAPFFDDGSGKLAGKAYVLSGANGAQIRSHVTPQPVAENRFGIAVLNLGDQNGDGVDDYLIGDSSAAKVHLYSGANGGSLGNIASPAGNDSFGLAAATVSDYDGDGKNDFWVSALESSRVYLLNRSGTVLIKVDDPSPGDSTGTGRFGRALASTQDLGGDSGLDLVVGEPGEPVSGTDGAGAAYVVTLRMNRPPVANAGADQTIECDRNGTVTLDGSASSDPDGDPITFAWKQTAGATVTLNVTGAKATFAAAPPGIYTFELTVTDDKGASATDSMTVTIRDTSAPTLTLALSPETIWPPNHKMVNIAATLSSSDVCDASPVITLVSVTSNEPVNSTGDGNTQPDIQGAAAGTDDRDFSVRSERKGNAAGRIYTATYAATDGSGNATTKSAVALVPKK